MKSKSNSFRVAIIGIFHESNTFIERETRFEDFKKGRLLRGSDIRRQYEDAHHEIGGMLEVLDKEGVEVVSLFFAAATPGGVIAESAYKQLLKDMVALLKEAFPVDGCLLVPHGAGVVKQEPDMDGHWMSTVRQLVGPQAALVGTLDPHANVSRRMIEATDALVAYKTNPHIDQRETGRKAAQLMVAHLQGKIKLRQYGLQPLATISIEQQYTSRYPCSLLYDEASHLESHPKILSISILLGFPYADVQEMGTSFLVVTNDDEASGQAALDSLQQVLLTHHRAFVGQKESITSQLDQITVLPKPVLWLDMGDNVGGGSPGDSVYLLKILEEDGRLKSFSCIYDAQAVQVAAQHAPGDSFVLSFGNDYAPEMPSPYATLVTLITIVDGRFSETMPRHGGEVDYNMGKTVIVQTTKGNTVMIQSIRVPPFSLNQLTAFGIDPTQFEVITAKGVNAPIAAYGLVCKYSLQANTPGVTQADMTQFTYQNRRRPLYPFEPLLP